MITRTITTVTYKACAISNVENKPVTRELKDVTIAQGRALRKLQIIDLFRNQVVEGEEIFILKEEKTVCKYQMYLETFIKNATKIEE